MAKLSYNSNLSLGGGISYRFYCPGCKFDHLFHIPQWSFNGNHESPTFSPSLLNTIDYTEKDRPALRCHLYVTDGQIRFLSDCSHELAGQVVPMPDLPDLPKVDDARTIPYRQW